MQWKGAAVTRTEIEGSYRSPSFEKAQVSDAMHPGVVSCSSDTSLRLVAQTMAQRHIHSVVVSDVEGPAGWGVVTDIDLLGAADSDLEIRTAGEIADTELPKVGVEESLPHAARLMADHKVAHLIVVDPDTGGAVGVLSTLDVAGVLAWGRA
jgi:CBS domain-containing protein